MSTRGRSASPPSRDVDVDMDKQSEDKLDAKVIVITNLTRNVVETHLQSVFGFYGEVAKIDLPIYVKCAYHTRPPFPFPLGTVVVFSLF
jgi:RNA-binding protein with serine-rich domain 1